MSRLDSEREECGNPKPASHGAARLRLIDFRNYAELDLALEPGFNVLAGENAQGKTNVLEALYTLSTTRLLRGKRDAEAIRHGRSSAELSAELTWERCSIGLTLTPGVRKRATINGASAPRAADLLGRLPTVCVTAGDLELAQGEPSDRRMFLDIELSALYPAYLNALTHYKRCIEQRNALLRSDYLPDASTFEPWEEELAVHGSALRSARNDFVAKLAPLASEVHGTMGGGEQLLIEYAQKDAGLTADQLRQAYASSRAVDAQRGGTSVGPHRDDLTLSVVGSDLRLFGSQGQQRTAVMALKLACLRFNADQLGAPPLLLLDDMLSDLDESRRSRLIDLVLEYAGQAVLTCTDTKSAGERILSRAKLFHVRHGTVLEQ